MKNQPAILYVEDDSLSREVMQMLLVEGFGLKNLTIFDGSDDFSRRVQALNPLPDLVLLDIHVKPIDGFSMLNILRTIDHFKTVPIVALTASVMGEEVQRLRAAGFSGAIAKPIDQDTFEDTLNLLLDGEQVWRIV
jgi:CheY-like chemotaxis protein